jgi:hypothetical protein
MEAPTCGLKNIIDVLTSSVMYGREMRIGALVPTTDTSKYARSTASNCSWYLCKRTLRDACWG